MGSDPTGTGTIDEEGALLALACGADDPPAAAQAREDLANEYCDALVLALNRKLRLPFQVAEIAAGEAMLELFDKVEADVGAVGIKNRGIWRWLLKAGIDAARDELRRLRRQARYHAGDGEPEPTRPPASDPAMGVESVDMASKILEAILEMDEPKRSILLHDAIDTIGELTDEEIELHDQELIDCAQEHPMYTKNSLRSHRTRARKDLESLLKWGNT